MEHWTRYLAAAVEADLGQAGAGYRQIRCRYRHLNGKGNGEETHRKVLIPGKDEAEWAADAADDVTGEWVPRARMDGRASSRKCAERGELPVGTLVLDYERSVWGGKPQGRADLRVAVVTPEPADPLQWLERTRRGGKVSVRLPHRGKVTIAER